jgi:hypothetical protein
MTRNLLKCKNPAKNIRCLPPNEGKVIFPFLKVPSNYTKTFESVRYGVLSFDEEKTQSSSQTGFQAAEQLGPPP